MSQPIPKIVVSLGTVAPPQEDVINCRVHLGATKEVSNFELLLQNIGGKYSPEGTDPILVGQTGGIGIGRGENAPAVISLKVESVKYEAGTQENYVRVSGRCWGVKLFDRVVTKAYYNKKGEYIVKDLLDNYVGLSHVRDSTELVEDTDTTYTSLEYENTPVWDILKYIAESSDKNGVIGYDFRVAPDGKFEFFPKNSKTSPVSLTETIEVGESRKDIHRVRNRIKVYGAMGRKEPYDGDAWTEDTLDGWIEIEGTLSLASNGPTGSKVGDHNILCDNTENSNTEVRFYHSRNIIIKNGMTLKFWYFIWQGFGHLYVRLYAPDFDNRFEADLGKIESLETWVEEELQLGPSQVYDEVTNPNGIWTPIGTPNWFEVTAVEFFAYAGPYPKIGIDGFYFHPLPFHSAPEESPVEDEASQNAYGLREYSETDEELISDYECWLRACALLAYLKDPAEYLKVSSTILDYGTTPLLPADKIYVNLPNESVHADYRIENVEYNLDAKTQTLEVAMDLGKEPPQLADYLYGLRALTVNVEKLSRTKLGRMSGGGYGGGGAGGIWTPNCIIMLKGGYIFIKNREDTYPFMCLKEDFLCFGTGGSTTPDVYLRRTAVNRAYLKALAGLDLDGHLIPFQDDTFNIGDGEHKWHDLRLAGGIYANLADFNYLNMGGVEILKADRYLYNVTADASIIAYGVFNPDRIPGLPASRITSGVFDPARIPFSSCPQYGYGYPACPKYNDPSFLGFGECPQYGCTNYVSGDLRFQNDFRITEAENLGLGHGLAFLNKNGKLVMVLDEDGNICIAGEVKKIGA
jgi:hypothetical protein